MPFGELAAPAIRHAREGVRVSRRSRPTSSRVLEPIVTHFPETRALYAPEGRHARARASSSAFPTSADALERLAAEGPSWIYAARSRERICDWVCERGGLLSPEDFGRIRVIERDAGAGRLPRTRGADQRRRPRPAGS